MSLGAKKMRYVFNIPGSTGAVGGQDASLGGGSP